ncbi:MULTISPECIES: response regulator transcription factor [unclassified Paenibacillus]|uniref:response regulator transcription factor n=1 Tax=unclassified Paenibacillus TaxID=185978 RepID=UPI0008387DD4|nr:MULTISPECIES: response regulator [unclassified Paenibacillus]NWL87655.1 DNA-binding response regulator [Paenibacillus sp. 79R4]
MMNVLVVDDESTEREGIKNLLCQYKFPCRVLEAENGRVAEEILQKNAVDILITDVKMPLMNGIELSKAARRMQENLKIVICSGYGEFEYALSAIKLGVINYLLKPLIREELLEVMENLTQKKAYIDPDQETEESRVIRQVKQIIKNNYQHDISLTDVGNEVYLSPGYLSILFKKETGMNFSKYLTDYRLRKADYLLTQTNMKINDIAENVGIENPSYFCKLFKNKYGVSPMQYRKC